MALFKLKTGSDPALRRVHRLLQFLTVNVAQMAESESEAAAMLTRDDATMSREEARSIGRMMVAINRGEGESFQRHQRVDWRAIQRVQARVQPQPERDDEEDDEHGEE